MFDFSSIKSIDAGGPRSSFEELMCQIAQLENITDKNVFRRVEGAGGDGGLEAYWMLTNGDKIGYQAKYFLKSGGIDWSQINGSVEEAFSCHPELTKYVIAVACDLTDVTGKKGKSGWEHWRTWSQRWSHKYKKPSGEPVEFEIWTASDLANKLMNTACAGLVKYFFDKTFLTKEWFQKKLTGSVVTLDERFTPEFHVNVAGEAVFQALLRSEEFIKNLYDFKYKIDRWEFPREILYKVKEFDFDENLITQLYENKINFLKIFDDVNELQDSFWDLPKWSNLTSQFLNIIVQLERVFSYNYEHESSYNLNLIYEKISLLENILNDFEYLINNKYFKCVNSKVALIYGAAGTGKSHLLAQGTIKALKEKHPSILLLGQNFNDETLSIQIPKKLELLDYNLDDFLSSLSIAGKVNRCRSLIVIDAINEGAGCRFWSNNLANFLSKLNDYENLYCIISCRKEYFHLAVPESVRNSYPNIEIKGFSTYEEQVNAAKVYLDKFNITRPSTPWLAPEFINPLFLKSLCSSLKKNNQTEIPNGLQGSTKLLKYYLENISKFVCNKESITVDLSLIFGRTLKNIAGYMFHMRRDYLLISECHQLINKNFHYGLKYESSWLDVFLNNGLLRYDPNINKVDEFDDDHVVRFTFQRFQDQFMAEKFIECQTDVCQMFELLENQFLFENEVINWNWRGLFSALAFILPEKHCVELVDVLPSALNGNWWDEWDIQESFVESIQWRSRDAFYDRSRELLNKLTYQDPIDILIKISTANHPWNAEFLNSKLLPLRMPERDSFWSEWVNDQSTESDSTIGVLLDWCLRGQQGRVKTENQYLASIVLCWFFSSSNRYVRDNATKSLTQLFRVNNDLFSRLLDNFIKVDDLYIIERLLASAYGACCIDKNSIVIRQYSRKVFDSIFINNTPPYGTLLRDYALGIIKLGEYLGCLDNEINLNIASPPYKSSKPKFNITESKLERTAHYMGGNQILWSAGNFMGDFGSYEIWPRVRNFINFPLNKSVPLTNQQKISQFRVRVDQVGGNVSKEFRKLERVLNPYQYGIYDVKNLYDDSLNPSLEDLAKWEKDKQKQKHIFLKLLDDQLIIHANEILPLLFKDNWSITERNLDKESVLRWVAHRAYQYGWTKKLFPNDRRSGSSRQRALTERIGKKYQWLALEELLSRLADNFWISDDYAESKPKIYQTPLDLGFQRDIDPTILVNFNHFNNSELGQIPEFSPHINIDEIDEEDLLTFPFAKDLTHNFKLLPFRESKNGEKWLVLYEYQSVKERYPDGIGEHGLRREEFRFLVTLMVKKDHASSIANFIIDKGINGIDSYIHDITDTAYFLEHPWRETWDRDSAETSSWYVPEHKSFVRFLNNFIWESHLDASLQDGINYHLPAPWVCNALNLTFNRESLTWNDSEGNIVIKNIYTEGANCCLINYQAAEKLFDVNHTFLTTYITERGAWSKGSNQNISWVRVEGVCWKNGKRVFEKTIMKDKQKNKK